MFFSGGLVAHLGACSSTVSKARPAAWPKNYQCNHATGLFAFNLRRGSRRSLHGLRGLDVAPAESSCTSSRVFTRPRRPGLKVYVYNNITFGTNTQSHTQSGRMNLNKKTDMWLKLISLRSFERLAPLLRAYAALALDTRFRLAEEDRRRFAPPLNCSTLASVKKMCDRSLTVESY